MIHSDDYCSLLSQYTDLNSMFNLITCALLLIWGCP